MVVRTLGPYAFNELIGESLRQPPAHLIWLECAPDANRRSSDLSFVEYYESALERARGQIGRHLDFFRQFGKERPTLLVSEQADQELVRLLSMFTWLRAFAKDRISRLEGWRASIAGCMPPADPVLAARLTTVRNAIQEAIHVFDWEMKTAAACSSQLVEEYDRRHPEARQLPVEPLDLGPTDSSFLPPAF